MIRVAVFAFLSLSSIAHAGTCERYLAYLDALIDEQVLSTENISAIENAPLRNPLLGALDSARKIHARELDTYLGKTDLSAEEIAQWARAKRQAQVKIEEERGAVTGETRSTIPIRMHKVSGGRFRRVLRDRAFSDVEITETIVADAQVADFEMMTSPVTMGLWEHVLNGVPVPFKFDPDVPIAMVTAASAMAFANLLSIERGLRPYYDLSGPNHAGKIADGTLAYFSEIRVDESANGFRLPKAIEYDYVVSSRGQRPDGRYPELTDENIDEYARTDSNSFGSCFPVCSVKPVVFDGMEFDDLLGNLEEWTDARATYGSGFVDSSNLLFSHRSTMKNEKSQLIGFRLARSLR